MCELLPIILACDDSCPNTHYSKVVHETDYCGETDVPRKGHSLLCFLDSNCKSKLRILRSACAHYPTLRSFLHAVYVARNGHVKILKVEQTLLNGDISALIDASSVSFDNLFSIVEEHMRDISNLDKPDMEMRLRDHNAEVFTPIIRRLSMTILRMCVVVVSSCIRKKYITVVRFDDHVAFAKDYLLQALQMTCTSCVTIVNL